MVDKRANWEALYFLSIGELCDLEAFIRASVQLLSLLLFKRVGILARN